MLSQASQQLCGGLFKAVFAFRMEGRMRQPSLQAAADGIDSEKLRYEHRFMPFFTVVTPPAIPCQQFRDMCDQVWISCHCDPRKLYAGAYQCFDDAKNILSSIPDPNEEVSPYSHPSLVLIHLLLRVADHFVSQSRQNESSSHEATCIWHSVI